MLLSREQLALTQTMVCHFLLKAFPCKDPLCVYIWKCCSVSGEKMSALPLKELGQQISFR